MRAALRVPGFRRLLISYAVNRAGDVVGSLALAVIVLTATGSALATAALFLSTQFLPGLLGPWIVARLDHLPSGRILPPLYAVECGLFLLLALLAGHVGVPWLMGLAFLDAALAFVARTLIRAATATILIPHDLMPEGKAAFNVALAAAMIAGPAVAGAAVSLLSARTALVFDAGSFALAGLILGRARGLRALPNGAAGGPDADQRGRLRAGLRYVWRSPALRTLIAGEGLAFVCFYLVVPVTVVYSVRSLHAGAGGYAAILTAWGVGIALGSAWQIRLARRIHAGMILTSTGAVAIGYLATGAAPTLAVACVASVVGGIGNGTQWASVETLLHQLVEERFRSRAASVLESLAALAPGAGILLGGGLTAALSPRAAYLAAGGALALLVLVAWVRRGVLGERASQATAGVNPAAASQPAAAAADRRVRQSSEPSAA